MAHILIKFVTTVFLVTIVFLCFDINTSGSLESSKTGRFLRRKGLLIYVKPYYSRLEQQLKFCRGWITRNSPSYDDVKNNTVKYYKILHTNAVDAFTIIKNRASEAVSIVLPYIPPDLPQLVMKYIMDLLYFIIEGLYIANAYINQAVDAFVKFLQANNILQENWKEQAIKSLDTFGKSTYSYINKFSEWIYKQAQYYLQ